jgi:pSer/pThr/pTyr-binding forkhead associated (FHA) protein
MGETTGTRVIERPGIGRVLAVRDGVVRWTSGETKRSTPLGVSGVVVGSSPDADLVVDEPTVSRRHVELRLVPGGCLVRDLDSKNGTFVDGLRLSGGAVPLPDGSRVVFGTLAATFHESGSMPTLTHFAG